METRIISTKALNNKRLKDHCFKKGLYLLFVIGCLIGGGFFLIIYGYKMLDFTYVNWLYTDSGSDLYQHQLGFDYFRSVPWSWPIGNNNNFAYPYGTSVVFTDSIPFLAIIFKAFNFALPSAFQYFGLWGIICYCLQGGFAAIILRRYICKWHIILLAVPIFVTASILMFRMFGHCSLASQWLILAAIFIFAYKEYFKNLKIRTILWASLCALSVAIHVYFGIMIGIMMVGFLIDDFIHFKKIVRLLVILGTSILATAAVFWLIGGFSSGDTVQWGLGYYSMNINSPFNRIEPNSILPFMQPLPTATQGQYEGLQYLGLGMFILMAFWIFCKVNDIITFFKKKHNFNKKSFLLAAPMIFICTVLTVLALSPVVTLNDQTLFSYMNFPHIQKVLNIFRSTGRLFWPVFYLIVLYLIVFFVKRTNYKKWAVAFFCVCIATQVLDISGFMLAKNQQINSEAKTNQVMYNPSSSAFWDQAGSVYKHVEVLYDAGNSDLNKFALYAMKHNMTINTGYLARADYSKIAARTNGLKKDLILFSNLKTDSLYILGDGTDAISSLYSFSNDKMIELKIDGYYVVISKGYMDLSGFIEQIIPFNTNSIMQTSFIKSTDPDYKLDMSGVSFSISDIIITDIPFKAGSTANMSFNFKNTSDQVFPTSLFFTNATGLSYHWYDKENNIVNFNYPRQYFYINIFPNDTIKVSMPILVPDVKPGKYKLMVDMTQENVGWASDINSTKYVYEIDIIE